MFRLHEAYAARPEMHYQLYATAIAHFTLFAPAYETNWSAEEATMIAEGLRRMDRLPDFGLALRLERAFTLKLSIDEDGTLPRPPEGSMIPHGWAGLAFSSWLDMYQFRIEQADVWPNKLDKPDPREKDPPAWRDFRKYVMHSDANIEGARWDCLAIKMRVVLSRLEHAYGSYRREHHGDIDQPDDLLQFLGGSLPVDPYTGKPHVIEREGDVWCMHWNVRGQAPGPDDVWRFPARRTPRQ